MSPCLQLDNMLSGRHRLAGRPHLPPAAALRPHPPPPPPPPPPAASARRPRPRARRPERPPRSPATTGTLTLGDGVSAWLPSRFWRCAGLFHGSVRWCASSPAVGRLHAGGQLWKFGASGVSSPASRGLSRARTAVHTSRGARIEDPVLGFQGLKRPSTLASHCCAGASRRSDKQGVGVQMIPHLGLALLRRRQPSL